MTEEGVVIAGCITVPLKNEDRNAMIKPVINRHGNVINPEIRSFFPGFNIQYSNFHVLRIRYQIKARAGMRYSIIFKIPAIAEKSAAAAVPVIWVMEPEKNRRIYREMASIYIPIVLFLYYNYNEYMEIYHVI